MKTFNQLRTLFGLWPVHGLHDLDLIDESPADLAQSVGPAPVGVEASTRLWSHNRVDGSAAPVEEAGAADHLQDRLAEIVDQMTVIVQAAGQIIDATAEVVGITERLTTLASEALAPVTYIDTRFPSNTRR